MKEATVAIAPIAATRWDRTQAVGPPVNERDLQTPIFFGTIILPTCQHWQGVSLPGTNRTHRHLGPTGRIAALLLAQLQLGIGRSELNTEKRSALPPFKTRGSSSFVRLSVPSSHFVPSALRVWHNAHRRHGMLVRFSTFPVEHPRPP